MNKEQSTQSDTDKDTDKKPTRKEIDNEKKLSLIKKMTKKQVTEWFGKIDRKNPLTISASGFWKLYRMVKGQSHYFTLTEKRQYILPAQIQAENLGKKTVVDIYRNAKAQLQAKIKDWEQRDTNDTARENAIKSINQQIGEFDTLMNKS